MKEEMNLKKLYEKMQCNMQNDSEAAGIFAHSGCTGTAREEFLREFLRQRLPGKYGIGTGKIISSLCDRQSKQIDIVIYDKENCPVLYSEGGNSIYPIECVYGIIEVKSALSKEKLEEGVQNILSVKRLLAAGGVRMKRSMPFGIVFGFDLAGNSLDSLENNLRELEQDLEPAYWVNMVVVLEAGIISHVNPKGLRHVHNSDDMRAGFGTIGISWEEESLFEFYIALHDMLVDMQLEKVHLRDYKELPHELGKHIVGGGDRFYTSDGERGRLSEKFIADIYDFCKNAKPMTQRSLLELMYHQVPHGMDEEQLERKVYLYNPDGLMPLPENFEDAIEVVGNTYRTKGDYLSPSWDITIDGEVYCIPLYYIARDGAVEKM